MELENLTPQSRCCLAFDANRGVTLNGKVERIHCSGQQKFYQLLSYKDDVDLEAKLGEWERFYNFAGPHGADNGQTPYEALQDKLQ